MEWDCGAQMPPPRGLTRSTCCVVLPGHEWTLRARSLSPQPTSAPYLGRRAKSRVRETPSWRVSCGPGAPLQAPPSGIVLFSVLQELRRNQSVCFPDSAFYSRPGGATAPLTPTPTRLVARGAGGGV